jgi:hypothetical protein
MILKVVKKGLENNNDTIYDRNDTRKQTVRAVVPL